MYHTHTHTHTHTHAHTPGHMHDTCMHAHMHTCTCTCTVREPAHLSTTAVEVFIVWKSRLSVAITVYFYCSVMI